MAGRTWSVVKFMEEDTVEAVPTTWLLGNMCYWPPYPREKLVAAIKNYEAPNTHWPSHRMEVFKNGTFETYLEARRKSNVAEYLSDLNQEDEPHTRKNRHKKQMIDSSSEDEVACANKEKNLPKPPTRPTNDSVEDSIPIITNAAYGTPVSSDTCGCCPIHKGIKIDAEIKKIKKQYVFLTNIMADMKTDLAEIKSAMSTRVPLIPEESFFLKFSLPIDDQAGLEEVENYLNISDNFQKTVLELANLGGNNVNDFVKRSMTFLITNKFATTFSFLGRKQKKSFSILKLSDLLIKAADYAKKGDRKEVEDGISKWLRRASERKGN